MPGERLSMRIREVLRLRFGQGPSQRVIGQSLRLSVGAVNAYLSRSRMAGLGWPLPAKFDDAQLETLRATRPDRALFHQLAGCDWIRHSQRSVISGPTGVSKSWPACALGHKACREGFSVLYRRAPRLFAELAVARGECRLPRMLAMLERTRLLIIDDWGPNRSPPSSGVTCSRSSMTATRRGRCWLPARRPSNAGTNSWATRRSARRSWTASSTAPIASS